MADQSSKPARNRAATTLAALAIVATLVGTASVSKPAAASDRLAETILAAALFYGLSHAQADHFYDRGYYFDPQYYYFDDRRGHWRAHNRQSRRLARQHRRFVRDQRRFDRRYYGHKRSHNRGYRESYNRGYKRFDDGNGYRSKKKRDRKRKQSRRGRDRDNDRNRGRNRGHNKRGR